MRVLLLLLGIALGVAGTLAYALFANSGDVPPPPPLPAHPAVTVTVSDAFLATVVRSAVHELPAGSSVDRVDVALEPDTIVVRATVDLLGRTTSGTARLRPVLRSGQLRVEVVDTSLGSLPLPAMEQVIEREINTRVRSLLSGMQITITGVRVDAATGLTVTCQVDPEVLAAPDAAMR